MKIKVVVVLWGVLFSMLFFQCAEQHGEKQESTTGVNMDWGKGREQFLNNCSYCHVPLKRKEEFADYILTGGSTPDHLEKVLRDTNHLVLLERIEIDTLALKEIQDYIFKIIPSKVIE